MSGILSLFVGLNVLATGRGDAVRPTDSQRGFAPPALPEPEDVYPEIPVWQGKKVLHFGDSHVSAGLTAGLKRHLKAAGARYTKRCWVGSRAKSWLVSGRLGRLLGQTSPEVVIVTLGTNAMVNHRVDKYAAWIEKVARQVGQRKCYWIGPPPLIDDENGFNEMMAARSRPCRYFDSRTLDISKRADAKFHLTRAQGLDWAEQIWRWMNGELVTKPFGR